MTAGAKLALLVLLAASGGVTANLWAQEVNVTGHVALEGAAHISPANSTVVWLTPIGADPVTVAPMHAVLQQKNKTFEPHLLAVTKGSTVDFPNRDPWFHNVFSLFNGKRFDLGLYEAGSTRSVLFDKPGICYLFCNIHPEMSAVVVVLRTRYYAVSDRSGEISIAGVPPGRYELQVWNERSLPDDLKSLIRQLDISGSAYSLGTISVRSNPNHSMTHKNKYGRDYDSPTPPGALYGQP